MAESLSGSITVKLLDNDGDPDFPCCDSDCNDVNSSMVTNPEFLSRYIPSINSNLVIRQQSSQGLSFQLWPAATTLVTLLDNYRHNSNDSSLSTILTSPGEQHQHHRWLRILELGSGTGFVGIAAAAILSANVTVTDLSHVTSNLKFNVVANRNVLASNNGVVDVAELNWGRVDHMEAVGRDYDVVLGSDLVYHDHLFEPLIETLKYFLLGGERRKMVFLMAHLKRWKKESVFFKKAKKHFAIDVVYQDNPSDGQRVGVVVYRFLGKQ